MRNRCLKIALTAGFLLFALSGYAFASPIQAEHRVCERDEDCSLITLRCLCTICEKSADVDAVNKKFSEQFAPHCTDSEKKTCAEEGACPAKEIPSAVCQNRQCAVVWRPNPNM